MKFWPVKTLGSRKQSEHEDHRGAGVHFSMYSYRKYYSFKVSPLSGRVGHVRFHLDDLVVQMAAVFLRRG